ncbi:hypothetical protein GpartN1_g5793.t1 [Galdieria partita]|uniref:mRNA (guanine-N(7))-methyltransferase n=1 Tax=Galdieria partita TaxID=83374 RepID=A0A9C7UST5_9RHOD|nr:hypothetical protein GpartN1_g5793.t1 [Galdieria partita]
MSHLLLTRDRLFGRLRNILRWISESLAYQLVDENSRVCLFCSYPAFCLGPLLYAFPTSVPSITVVCWTLEECQQAQQFVQQQYPNRFQCQYIHCNFEETLLASVLTDRYDVILCWGWLERLFSSLELVKEFLTQVSLKLQPKGFFAGITTHSSYIWTMAQKYLERHSTASYPMMIENQLWTLILPQGDVFSAIGTPVRIRYHSELRMSRIAETEYWVHAPTLFHYCDSFGLEWIDWLSGRDWWSSHRNIGFQRLMEMGVVTKESRYLSKEEYEMLSIFACFITIKHSSSQ